MAAIEAAARACALTDWRDADSLLTLAAYAEAGEFVRAVEHQEKAITLTDGAGGWPRSRRPFRIERL